MLQKNKPCTDTVVQFQQYMGVDGESTLKSKNMISRINQFTPAAVE